MTPMLPFTDRLFYLERTDEVAHLTYLTSGMWALHLLQAETDWTWTFEASAATYHDLFRQVAHLEPVLLVQAEWHEGP